MSGQEPTAFGYMFGVRHLSPMGAARLYDAMEAIEPTAVVIELPADCEPLLELLVDPRTRPPIALLSHSRAKPVRSTCVPLARYSPEWVALREGIARGASVRFMDLPAAISLALDECDDETPRDASPRALHHTDPLSALEQRYGDPAFDPFWERTFEHALAPEAYRESLLAVGSSLRAMDRGRDSRENLLRESHMRHVLAQVIEEGHDPARVLIVCGAFHCDALHPSLSHMHPRELGALPKIECAHTLIPYSNRRLSSWSGYGAGNIAPRYYESLFDAIRSGEPTRAAIELSTALAQHFRDRGQAVSTGDAIECVRLAQELATMDDGVMPTLRDIVDAARATMLGGDPGVTAESILEVAIGADFGSVSPRVSRSSLRLDFDQTVSELRLTEHLSDRKLRVRGRARTARGSALDLREDVRAKRDTTALRDRHVSVFLHRLCALGLSFARLERSDSVDMVRGSASDERNPNTGSFRETWSTQWTPECELRLLECSQFGDTVASATSQVLRAAISKSKSIVDVCALALECSLCELQGAFDLAAERIARFALGDHDVVSLARSARELATLTRYGSVRKIDFASLNPMISQLVVRASLALPSSAMCNAARSGAIQEAMRDVSWVVRSGSIVDDQLVGRWREALRYVSIAAGVEPSCSGFALALRMQHQTFDDELATVVATRLCPGTSLDDVSGFVRGLFAIYRANTLQHPAVLKAMVGAIDAMTDEDFMATVAGLRAGFADFSQAELNQFCQSLVRDWRSDGPASALLNRDALRSDQAAMTAFAAALAQVSEIDLF
ncbi:MAG: DUF5682 family protein [Deltaproteobacteria bacterium]|nr:DUF5682 family protein [Deltaproteobacteria bacterium]